VHFSEVIFRARFWQWRRATTRDSKRQQLSKPSPWYLEGPFDMVDEAAKAGSHYLKVQLFASHGS
jgi:hypothetical protein